MSAYIVTNSDSSVGRVKFNEMFGIYTTRELAEEAMTRVINEWKAVGIVEQPWMIRTFVLNKDYGETESDEEDDKSISPGTQMDSSMGDSSDMTPERIQRLIEKFGPEEAAKRQEKLKAISELRTLFNNLPAESYQNPELPQIAVKAMMKIIVPDAEKMTASQIRQHAIDDYYYDLKVSLMMNASKFQMTINVPSNIATEICAMLKTDEYVTKQLTPEPDSSNIPIEINWG